MNRNIDTLAKPTCSATSSRLSAARCIRTVSSSSMASSLACPPEASPPVADADDFNSLTAVARHNQVDDEDFSASRWGKLCMKVADRF